MPLLMTREGSYREGYAAGYRAALSAFRLRLLAGWAIDSAFNSLRGFWLDCLTGWAENGIEAREKTPPPSPAQPRSGA